ncbi:hypothetical protein ACH5Y9_21735 [Methylomonas sp. BW4-1]|uniref:hypothetical protein n=1 Tax=Methylomonas sp. BW4-1 TaxID=3376685 RepID=UPI004041E90D
MNAKEKVETGLAELVEEGGKLLTKFEDKKKPEVRLDYQVWYSKALRAMQLLAADRYEEFRRYYEPDPKRKSLGYGTYVIHDYIKGVAPGAYQLRDFDTRGQAAMGVYNQLLLLTSVVARSKSVLADIQGTLLAELQDEEIDTAEALLRVNARAAGALAGVILESHLQKIAEHRGVKIAKKSPTIADLNEPLKTAGVYDITVWRKLSYFADIRNLCSHKKTEAPTNEQVRELIDGVRWAIKNVA